MSDDEIRVVLAGATRPVKFRKGRLELVHVAGPLSGPVGIVRDLPPNFWHPSMDALGEELVGEEEDEKKPPTWLMRAGATVMALCFLAIIVAGTVRVVGWILEGM